MGFANCAGNLVNDFSFLEDDQGRDSANTKFSRGYRVVIDVHFSNGNLSVIFFCEFFDNGGVHQGTIQVGANGQTAYTGQYAEVMANLEFMPL